MIQQNLLILRGIKMSYVIYIIPLVLFIGTTLYYNVKSGTYYSNKLVVGFSILDVITVYSFSMAFLSRIITPQITNIFIYLSIFSVTLLIQITLFEKMVGGTADAIKTLKENIAILFTSFVPFLLFLYFFRQVNYDSLRVLLAVVFSFLIFYISLFYI